jgi:tetraacyldisaccharide 4'-kinase
MPKLRLILIPFSILYMGILWIRNRLFDLKILKSQRGALPTIVIGNLSVGGTGKTPHIQYLIHLLKEHCKVAVLSRGYQRASVGFILVDTRLDSQLFGDEPAQLARNNPDIPLAVCENRLDGLNQMKELYSKIDWVLMDDAFQHRALLGDLNILLTTFQQPFHKDYVLPAGDLRDHPGEKRRADAILVTKCPDLETPPDVYEWRKALGIKTGQALFFSKLKYGKGMSVYGNPDEEIGKSAVVGFAGIARPKDFENYLKSQFDLKKFKNFPDHHQFTLNDLEALKRDMLNFGDPDIVLVTTEKDLSRLTGPKESALLKSCRLFVVPVEIEFLPSEPTFDSWLLRKLEEKKEESLHLKK